MMKAPDTTVKKHPTYVVPNLLKILLTRSPKSLSICTLLNKPSRREVEVDVDWVGFDIPDAFGIGYGIDYAQQGRNLPHIGVVKDRVANKAILFSALDNLVKGASGQAVQNMNLLYKFHEHLGLKWD